MITCVITNSLASILCLDVFSLFAEDLIWWVNGVGQLVVGIFGFLAGSLTLAILPKVGLDQKKSVRQESTFNHLLVPLAVSDNLHYICSLGMAIIHLTPVVPSIRGTYFPQFHAIFFMISFYIFLALVFERLMALSKIRNSTGTLKGYFFSQPLFTFIINNLKSYI